MKKDIEKDKEEMNNERKWKIWIKKFGIRGIIFFTVKGIITSSLIYFLGKNFWSVISEYVSQLFK
ncbi:hypothetical protein [Chryseobacterium sp.]|uniref:hypothetical protein n=1 Tax=Chryseobacterium sp. TaxID=1871047 RepID=UPI00388EA343